MVTTATVSENMRSCLVSTCATGTILALNMLLILHIIRMDKKIDAHVLDVRIELLNTRASGSRCMENMEMVMREYNRQVEEMTQRLEDMFQMSHMAAVEPPVCIVSTSWW